MDRERRLGRLFHDVGGERPLSEVINPLLMTEYLDPSTPPPCGRSDIMILENNKERFEKNQ